MSKENLSKNIAKTISAIVIMTSLNGCGLQIKSSTDIVIESNNKDRITNPNNNCTRSTENNSAREYPDHFYQWQGILPIEDPSKTRA